MNVLLDTHSLLWSLFSQGKLSSKVSQLLQDRRNSILVSVISLWEIALKFRRGTLLLENILPDEIPEFIRKQGFSFISISPEIAASFYNLKILKHKDPFDRMLVWQAIKENATLVSKDRELDEYKKEGLRRIW